MAFPRPRPSSHLNLNDCFLEGRNRAGRPAGRSRRASPRHCTKFWLVHASRCRLLLQALQALLAQNQLRFGGMAKSRHCTTRSPAAPVRARAGRERRRLVLGAWSLAGGAGRRHPADGSGIGEPMVLGLLALLAVAGVFLVFGLLSGFLRLSERAPRPTGQDGRRRPGQRPADRRRAAASVVYRNRALQRLTGTRSGRHATLEELFAGEPQSARGLLPPQPRGRARARRATRSSTSARDALAAAAAGAGCRVSVRPFTRLAPRQAARAAHALAGAPTSPASACAKSRPSAGSRRRWRSTTGCRRGCSRWPPTAASLHINATLGALAGPAARARPPLTLPTSSRPTARR